MAGASLTAERCWCGCIDAAHLPRDESYEAVCWNCAQEVSGRVGHSLSDCEADDCPPHMVACHPYTFCYIGERYGPLPVPAYEGFSS